MPTEPDSPHGRLITCIENVSKNDFFVQPPDNASSEQIAWFSRDQKSVREGLTQALQAGCNDFLNQKIRGGKIDLSFLPTFADALSALFAIDRLAYVDFCAVLKFLPTNYPQIITNPAYALLLSASYKHLENSLNLASETAQRQNMRSINTETLDNVTEFCAAIKKYYEINDANPKVTLIHKKCCLIITKINSITLDLSRAENSR